MSRLPYLTAELPGTGGILRERDEDFQVEEVPAYAPGGEGDHVFVGIEKRGLTTFDAIGVLARAADVRPRDVGYAGLKDRHAVARQTLSLPPPARPEDVEHLETTQLRVLWARRHRHKLRTGHLRGNRFRLRIRQLDVPPAVAAERASAVLEQLRRPPGSPNWFGAQRFGADGRNAELGRALVTGEQLPGKPPRGRRRRLLVSAYQSLLFNEYLVQRIDEHLYDRVLAGDLLQKRPTGGVFWCEAPDTDQARLEAGELVPTGPMFGHRMRRPPAGTAAAEREDRILEREQLALADFERAGKLAQGTRRALAVDLGEVGAAAGGDTVELTFQLPAGSYATAVVREVIKGSSDFPG